MTPRSDPIALLMADLPARFASAADHIEDRRGSTATLAIANALEADFTALARSWREREQNTKEGK